MKYAIIAAGEGSRLAAEGISQPKPLVRIGDEPMIDRLIRIFMQNDADEIAVICNDTMPEVASHLQLLQRDGLQGRPVPLRFIVKSTPSSMHSLYELSPLLGGGSEPVKALPSLGGVGGGFILTTVDTIFREDEFADYVRTFQRLTAEGACDGLMGVTDYIDDEKPLYVAVERLEVSGERLEVSGERLEVSGERLENTCSLITGFYDNPPVKALPSLGGVGGGSISSFGGVGGGPISAGIYGLMPPDLVTLRHCVERGEQRMRNYQRALLLDGLRLQAYPFTHVFDIDHAADIEKANTLIGKVNLKSQISNLKPQTSNLK